MDLDIKKILLEYKIIDNNKLLLNKEIVEEGYVDAKKIADMHGVLGLNKLLNLDPNFYPVIEKLIPLLTAKSCKITLTSGRRPVKTNKTSLHPHGRAIDFVFRNNVRSCLNYMPQICKTLQSEFKGLYCLNEYVSMGGVKTKDTTGDNYHIEWAGKKSKNTKTTDNKPNPSVKLDNISLGSESGGGGFASEIGKEILGKIMDSHKTNKQPLKNNYHEAHIHSKKNESKINENIQRIKKLL